MEVVDTEFTGSNHPPEDDPAQRLMDQVESLLHLGEVELMAEARKAGIRLLLAKLKLGTITAPELAVLRNLLRDNGLVLAPEPDTANEAGGSSPIGFHLPVLDEDNE